MPSSHEPGVDGHPTDTEAPVFATATLAEARDIVMAMAAEERDELVVHDLDDLLGRTDLGEQLLADGERAPHRLHVFDVGVGGDGLRGPMAGVSNPHRVFLAHADAPEVAVESPHLLAALEPPAVHVPEQALVVNAQDVAPGGDQDGCQTPSRKTLFSALSDTRKPTSPSVFGAASNTRSWGMKTGRLNCTKRRLHAIA